jgi:predicted Zn-dependent protease
LARTRGTGSSATTSSTIPTCDFACAFLEAGRRSTRDTINGIPAVVTTFEAQTPQGIVGGYVAHLSYGDLTYRILTYASSSAFAQVQQIFTGIIGSFAPLTERSILDVQPRRIDIVRLSRSLSVAEFQQMYPSSIPLDLLTIINQVPSPSARLETGMLVKRVVGEDVESGERIGARGGGTSGDTWHWRGRPGAKLWERMC